MMMQILLPAGLGLVGIYLLLPRPRTLLPSFRAGGMTISTGGVFAALALVAAGWLFIRTEVVNAETILFYAFSAVAIVAGGLLVTQRNPVHAALAFALVVLSTCGLFLLLAAPFLMAATIIIYAGAIIVTFLFVIMLAQQTGLSDADARSREPLLSCIAGFLLLGAILFVLHSTYNTKELGDLLSRIQTIAAATSPATELGNDEAFLANLQQELEKIRGGPDKGA